MLNYPHLPKRPRLINSEYKGCKKYFLTLKTFNNIQYFTKQNNIKFVEKYLYQISKQHKFEIWLYLFMPDHLHLLAWAQNKDCDLEKFVKIFKQLSGYYFKKATDYNLWGKSYYDHILRAEEAVKDVIDYILNNPVRKGLVKKWTDYQYFGSTIFTREDFYYY